MAFTEVHVPRRFLLAGPVEHVMRIGGGAGSLTTSTLAVGVTRGVLARLAHEAERRAELVPIYEVLEAECKEAAADLYAAATGTKTTAGAAPIRNSSSRGQFARAACGPGVSRRFKRGRLCLRPSGRAGRAGSHVLSGLVLSATSRLGRPARVRLCDRRVICIQFSDGPGHADHQMIPRMCSMKFRVFGFLTLLLLVPGFVEAGTGRQTTTFLVEADPRTVCRWIEQNSAALDESSGAEVLSLDGRDSKLRKETKEGTFTLVFDHGPNNRLRPGRAVSHGVGESDNPTLVSQETKIRVEQDGSGSRVTITGSGRRQYAQRDVDRTGHPAINPRNAETARKPLRLAERSG